MNTIPRKLRLKENHPTAIKLLQLFEFADKLGIGLCYSSHAIQVLDSERDKTLPPLYLQDVEDSDYGGNFPPTTEYKLVYDNPCCSKYIGLSKKLVKEKLSFKKN